MGEPEEAMGARRAMADSLSASNDCSYNYSMSSFRSPYLSSFSRSVAR